MRLLLQTMISQRSIFPSVVVVVTPLCDWPGCLKVIGAAMGLAERVFMIYLLISISCSPSPGLVAHDFNSAS